MAVLPILLHPDPRLKKSCEPIGDVDAEIRKLADSMMMTMYDAPGIGLAAPQVGVLKRIFVMDCASKDEEPAPQVIINPEITWASDDINVHNEGCLSLPELFEDIERPASIQLAFLDQDGKPQEMTLDGIQATCAQHEIDHLNGTLFIDHLSRMKRSILTKKMIKFKKEMARA